MQSVENPFAPESPASATWAVVVLAGGEARRMGGEKPLRLLRGRPLIEHVMAKARSWSRILAVSVRDAEQGRAIGHAPWLVDAEGQGPVAGCAAALNYAAKMCLTGVLTVPCDTPRLPADLLDRLAAALTPETGVAVAVSRGRLHPTCALWRSRCAPLAARYIARGRSSLVGLTEVVGRVDVDWPDGAADPFININSPEELAAFEAACWPGGCPAPPVT